MGVVNFSIPKELVLSIIRNTDIDNFVETGTYLGHTTFWAAHYFKKVYTIEISPKISKQTALTSDCPKNIDFIVGDSRLEMPKLVRNLNGRSFFWLDGHWCSGAGGKDAECPLMDELKAISACEKPVIFIDDARCFLGPLPAPHNYEDWPTIDEIFTFCKNHFPNSYTTIIDDVIICVPEEVKPSVYNYWQTTFAKRYNQLVAIIPPKSFFEREVTKIYSFLKKRLCSKNKKELSTTEIVEMQKRMCIERNKWLQDKDIQSILDIGANTGQFAQKARWLFPDAKIYSFEPILSVYEKLKENFVGDVNFEAYNTALGEEEGLVTFFQNEFSDSSSLLKMKNIHKENFPFTQNESKINVNITTLDKILHDKQIGHPYLVKIDVQGFEEKVINGGKSIVENADYIITEVSYVELYEGQPLFDVIYAKLTGMGFQYIGNFEQLLSPKNNEILQADAIFKKVKK